MSLKKTALYLILAIMLALVVFAIWFNSEQPQMLRDPVFDNNDVTLSVSQNELVILVFSKTNGFRHKGAISAASRFFQETAKRRGWSVVVTENGAAFTPENLASFDLLIWNNATGPLFTDAQQLAVQNFIEQGGGFVGIHSAGDGSHRDWEWYQQDVIRTEFIGHPVFPLMRSATVQVENPQHPILEGLPASWSHTDEWYSFTTSPRATGVTVLLTVNEADYSPSRTITGRNLMMGSDHPVVWTHSVGDGRVVYSALGHDEEVFSDPHVQQMLSQSIQWVGKLADK